MKKIQLKPTREWQGTKGENLNSGAIRIYVGSLWVGTALPAPNPIGDIQKYYFQRMLDYDGCRDIGKTTLEEIKSKVEAEMMAFADKFLLKYTILKKVDKPTD